MPFSTQVYTKISVYPQYTHAQPHIPLWEAFRHAKQHTPSTKSDISQNLKALLKLLLKQDKADSTQKGSHSVHL